LRINDLYVTLQGEGVQTGLPMVLIRLMGCAVGCPWCDTKETWVADPENRVTVLQDALGTNALWTDAGTAAIAATARQCGPRIGWALVTGGEPADQDLVGLVLALHSQGFKAALETSGTALGHVGAGFDWVCVSPKFKMPGGKRVLPEALSVADEIKQVIAKPEDLDVLDLFLHDVTLKPGCAISLQPVSQQPKATQFCVDTCLARGWRLSLQQHKFLNVR